MSDHQQQSQKKIEKKLYFCYLILKLHLEHAKEEKKTQCAHS